MWTEAKNQTWIIHGNDSKMVDPDQSEQRFSTEHLRNGSTAAAAHPSSSEEPSSASSGIIPGAFAAALFITLLLGLYAVLWKCMVSPPTTQRKKRKRRGQVQQRTLV